MASNKRTSESSSSQLPAARRRRGNDEASSGSEPESPFHNLDEGTRELIRDLLREKDEARNNYSEETKRSQRLAAELEVAQFDRVVVRAQLTAADSRVVVLEMQVQALQAAAATATDAVNAWGDTVVARLQDIPNCHSPAFGVDL